MLCQHPILCQPHLVSRHRRAKRSNGQTPLRTAPLPEARNQQACALRNHALQTLGQTENQQAYALRNHALQTKGQTE